MVRYRDREPCEEKKEERERKASRRETKRKRERRERDGTREEKPTNDWSNRGAEWYRARPIGTVGHLRGLVPFIDQAPGPSRARSREDREILVDTPFLCSRLLPPNSPAPSCETSYANATVHGGRATIGQLSTRHLESGTSTHLSRRKRETFGPAEYSLEKTVFLKGDGRRKNRSDRDDFLIQIRTN